MEWLFRWWRDLFRDVVLTGAGVTFIATQVVADHPNTGLIAAGLALTAPSTYVRLRELGQPGSPGSGQPPPQPPSSEPSTSSPADIK